MPESEKTARTVNPVQFFSDAPYAIMGDASKKDFSAKITKVSPDEKSDPDDENSEQDDGETKPVETVDAPELNASSGGSGDVTGAPGSSAPADEQSDGKDSDQGDAELDLTD